MDEDTKRRFDGVVELWKHCWQSIAERQKGEWRAAYTLWTAFAALIALILKLPVRKDYFPLGVFGIGLALCIIHGLWLVGIGKRHSIDREMAFHYEDILRELSNSGFDGKLKGHLEEIREKQKAETSFRTLFGDWSRGVQFLVTVVLSVSALLASLAVAP